MTIRTRLTLLFSLLVGAILLLFSVAVNYFYNYYRSEEFHERLEEKALTTARLWQDVGRVPEDDLISLPNEQITLYNAKQQVVFHSGKTPFPITSAALRQLYAGQTLRLKQDSIEAVGLRFQARPEPLVVVASAHDRYGLRKASRLRQLLFVGWLAVMGVVALSGWIFARDALRPVKELIEQADTISATNIDARLHVGHKGDELAQLASTFNALLMRLQYAFITQKSFVSNASHELRTPLAVMQGHIEVARLKARNQAEYEATLDNVLDEVRGMIELVNGLLELARASADAAALSYRPTRIDETLWQARTLLLHKKPEYQVTIDFATLPDQEGEMVMLADESLLRTAFQNLMENGCKYSVNQSVTVSLTFGPKQIRLTFTDHGYGIAPADLPHVFEPFFRAERTADRAGGFGIGLALTQRIIALHQGTIQLESEEGRGTTVSLTLPLHQTVVPAPALAEA